MKEIVFNSVEELKEFLHSLPDDQFAKITVVMDSEETADGKEETGGSKQ